MIWGKVLSYFASFAPNIRYGNVGYDNRPPRPIRNKQFDNKVKVPYRNCYLMASGKATTNGDGCYWFIEGCACESTLPAANIVHFRFFVVILKYIQM